MVHSLPPICTSHIVKIHIDCNEYDCGDSYYGNKFYCIAHTRKVFHTLPFNAFCPISCKCGLYVRSLDHQHRAIPDKSDSSYLKSSIYCKVKWEGQSESVLTRKDSGWIGYCIL